MLYLTQEANIAGNIAFPDTIRRSMLFVNVKDARRIRLNELWDKLGTLKKLAHTINPDSKFLDKYLNEITNGTREMGDKLARRIERRFDKPDGWMDGVGTSSVEAGELLRLWGQFPTEEQIRLIDELRIRLRVIKDRAAMQEIRQEQTPRRPIIK